LVGGKLKRIVTPSAERVPAFCQHFDTCGGCKFQHWQEKSYAAWKRNLLVDALRAKGFSAEVEPLVDAHGAGRRRVSLHVRQQAGIWVAGFMEQQSHDLCALKICPVLVPALQHSPMIAAAFGAVLGPCDVAITAADNGLDVHVKAERSAVLRRLGALNDILEKYQVLRLSVNGEIHTAVATPFIKMGKASVQLPVQSFLQATQRGEEILSELVTANIGKSKNVADLFCGLGPFAFRMAELAKVTAIDSDKPAIACMQTAVRNTQGLKPITVETRDLFRVPLVPSELKAFDTVVFDPPRSGADAQARQLAKSTVKRVIAVACDVGNFTKDAAILVQGGYTLQRVIPVDQFKWTAHLEMVGVFERLQG
jgi:23S rRNA (uracil1939-C5)-methyltransferase